MRRTVFYSWQSDSPSAINRNFIEAALKKATKAIAKDDTFPVEPAPDRDTSGIPGSPAITDSILAKIEASAVFVCDLTIVNPDATGRLMPNPNVLLELGYAVARLGWSRIVLVMNTSFGGIEQLPFDVQGRRIVWYRLKSDDQDKAAVRNTVAKQLEEKIRSAFAPMVGSYVPDRKEPIWWGKWSSAETYTSQGAYLHVREVGERGFIFKIFVNSGTHTGELTAFARFTGPDSAYAWIEYAGADEPCELSFTRNRETRRMTVEEGDGCLHYHGMGVRFDCVLKHEYEPLYESGILDDLDLGRLYGLMGSNLWRMNEQLQLTGPFDNLDEFPATVKAGFVRGAAPFNAGVVMRGEDGQLWAAFIDGDVVRYFTTEADYKTKLPLTFEKWREGFSDKPIIYDSPVDAIEGRFH